jgi:colanic acid biosynthesis glycosyl transferase WcaI
LKFLLLNQTFHPDVVATAQYLTQLALGLKERGHEVTVISSRRAYDHPEQLFPREENWRGIRIIRIASTGFGKGAKWRRAMDFASFMARCASKLAFLPRHDVIVALTSPPLISYLGARLARLRRSRFVYWVMDFNPDEAIAAGWLRPGSLTAKLLERLSRFSLRQASRIIALDRFMRDRIVAKGISSDKVSVIPPWAQDDQIAFDPAGRDLFRRTHGLENKFVVIHSGNHSPCHPLDTLLAVARRLSDVSFCFVGGGSEFQKIKQTAEAEKLPNVLCLPYQPLERLSSSLSAADLHVVVMGEPFVGLIHPCKIYNIIAVSSPILYIGPTLSHVTEILDAGEGAIISARAGQGEVGGVIRHIEKLRKAPPNRTSSSTLHARFSKETLLPKLIVELESCL